MGEQSLSVNPILYRVFYMLTPPSELPDLPKTVRSYWPVHAYTLTQIVATVVIFIVTLTVAGPAFPVIIIALVPVRLLVMNRIWDRNVLRYVDAWACRDGTPEDEEDRRAADRSVEAAITINDSVTGDRINRQGAVDARSVHMERDTQEKV